jgi:amino acid transporter
MSVCGVWKIREASVVSESGKTNTGESSRLTLRGATFLGIGAMVGAGIFALLGQAGVYAGAAVWLSFLLAGLMSAALGYTMAKLGVRYPSSGGLVVYLRHGYRSRRVVGVAAWLGYLTAIVVVGAMVAVSFGDYAAKLFFDAEPGGPWTKVFGVLLVVLASWMTIAGPRIVDRVQSLIVVALLAVFAVFIIGTMGQLQGTLLSPSGYPSVRDIISSVALTFFAFLGFAVITFAAGDLDRPQRDLPRAMYLSLGVTTVLYVVVALCVFGTLPVDEVIDYGPTAIAEAARPTLGDAGFLMMAIAALLATASSVTATLYAAQGLTDALAEHRYFPPVFGPASRLGRHGGLMITAALTLAFVTVLSLGALASVGSAVSLAVFTLVAWAAFRLRRELGASSAMVLAAVAVSIVVLIGFTTDLFVNDRRSFWVMLGLVALALIVDELWARRQEREPHAAR